MRNWQYARKVVGFVQKLAVHNAGSSIADTLDTLDVETIVGKTPSPTRPAFAPQHQPRNVDFGQDWLVAGEEAAGEEVTVAGGGVRR